MRHKNIEYQLYNFHILPFRHQSRAERLQAVQRRAINIILSFLEQPLMFLRWQCMAGRWHAVSPSKTLRSFQTFFSETFAKPIVVYTVFSLPPSSRSIHPVSGSQLYTQSQAFALKDIVLQRHTVFQISVVMCPICM